MDLQEFVKESLSQIFKGVKDAAEIARETGGTIDPKRYGKVEIMYDENDRSIQDVEFDVAVTVNESSDVKGGIF